MTKKVAKPVEKGNNLKSFQKCLSYSILIYSHLFVFAFWGSIVVGFYYYGFVQEGDWTCYATQNGDVLVPWNSTTEEVPDDYHDVNSNFRVVCIWGFFQYIYIYLVAMFFMFYKDIDSVLDNFLGAIGISVLPGICWFTHFLTMMIMRWRHAGKVCSGDYLDVPNRYSLFDATEPYLHDAGSFLFYAINS